MTDLTSLIKIIDDLTKFMTDLAVLEQELLDFVTKKDLKGLDDCLKKKQAQSLRLRGLDRTREQIAETLGFKGLSLSVILKKFPDEGDLQLSGNKLIEATKHFNTISTTAKRAIEVNLHHINKATGNQGVFSKPLESGTVFKNNSV